MTGGEASSRRAGGRVLWGDVDAPIAEWTRQRELEVEVATFKAWDPAGRAFDAVVSGQTWHWVNPTRLIPAVGQHVQRPGPLLARTYGSPFGWADITWS